MPGIAYLAINNDGEMFTEPLQAYSVIAMLILLLIAIIWAIDQMRRL